MTLQEQIRSNRLRTWVVVLGFAVLIAALVLLIGGAYDPGIAGFVGIGAIAYGIWSYFASGRVVARATGARPLQPGEHDELRRMVETLSIAAGLDRSPPVYIVDDPAPNAFAAGRTPETAYVAATTGLLELMDKRELEGVMAHELAHVRNQDVRLMTVATVLVGVIVLVADMFLRMSLYGGGRGRDRGGNPIMLILAVVAMVVAPIAAMALQMALSRRREFLADASAVEIVGDADGLARALSKLGADPTPLRTVTHATAHLYIESPLRDHAGLRSSLGGMFDTHPPLEERIRRLQERGGLVVPPAPH